MLPDDDDDATGHHHGHVVLSQDVVYDHHDDDNHYQSSTTSPPQVKKRYTVVPYECGWLRWLMQSRTNKYVYEVLPVHLPRRLYMDIDIPGEHPCYRQWTYEQIVAQATELVRSVLTTHSLSSSATTTLDQVVCFVVKDDSRKQSLHITSPVYLLNHEDTKNFVTLLRYNHHSTTLLPIDYAVYSRNQNFRLPYQSKYGKDVLILEPCGDCSFLQHFVGLYNFTTNTYTCLDSVLLASHAAKALQEMSTSLGLSAEAAHFISASHMHVLGQWSWRQQHQEEDNNNMHHATKQSTRRFCPGCLMKACCQATCTMLPSCWPAFPTAPHSLSTTMCGMRWGRP